MAWGIGNGQKLGRKSFFIPIINSIDQITHLCFQPIKKNHFKTEYNYFGTKS